MTTSSLPIGKYVVFAIGAPCSSCRSGHRETSLALGFCSSSAPCLTLPGVLLGCVRPATACCQSHLIALCSLLLTGVFLFCSLCRLSSAAETSSASPAPSAVIPSSTAPSAFHALQSRLVASSTHCMQAQPASTLQGTCLSPCLCCECKR